MTAVTTFQIDSTNPKKAVEQKSTNQAAHVYINGMSAAALANLTNDGWNRTAVDASGTTVIRTVAGATNGFVIFGGYQVVSAAGAFTLDLYDSAAAASGNKLCPQANVNILADYEQNINCTNGIVASASGDFTNSCVFILWK